MSWNNFTYRDTEYDLSHTHPFDHTFNVEIKGELKEYKCHVLISHHVFTESLTDDTDPDLIYRSDTVARDIREFDFIRYELSKQLPDLIRGLGTTKCLKTGKNNFCRLEVVDKNGDMQDYEIYFRLTKTKQRGWITLTVESAYVPNDSDLAIEKRKAWRSVRFALLARNTMSLPREK